MKLLALIPSSKLVKNVVRDVLYGCWCSGKRIGGATVPPYGMLSVASFLKCDGWEVEFLDANALQLEWEAILLQAMDANVVIMNSATMSIREDSELLHLIKKGNPDVKTVVFGAHATFMPESVMGFESIDYAVRGEPEIVLSELLHALWAGESPKGIKGVAYRTKNSLYTGEIAEPIVDLESMPFLDVTMLPQGVEYFNPVVLRFPYVTTVTSRGCPGKCTFCTAPTFYGAKIRYKSPERVADEVGSYLESGIKEIYFRDETFTFNKKRAKAICREFLSRGYDLSWIANARVGTLDEELLSLMQASGCHLVKFGVESGNQGLLDRVRKGIKVEQTVKDFRMVREAGIDSHAHIMLGMPGETRETLEQTIQFVIDIEPSTASFGLCTPFAGTPLYDELLQTVPRLGDGTSADLGKEHQEAFFNEHFTSLTHDELQTALRRAYRRFYLRPNYLWKRLLGLRSMSEFRNSLIAAANLFSFSTNAKG